LEQKSGKEKSRNLTRCEIPGCLSVKRKPDAGQTINRQPIPNPPICATDCHRPVARRLPDCHPELTGQ